jgi:hypothetical protein
MMPLSGVRISWLMRDRKSVFRGIREIRLLAQRLFFLKLPFKLRLQRHLMLGNPVACIEDMAVGTDLP